VAALLALMASLIWGSSDFVGGVVSRRLRPLLVVGLAHGAAVIALLVVAAVTASFGAAPGYLPWAIAAGLIGAGGLTAFYQALATGTMGVVAPIASTGAILPVIVGLAGGESPSALQLAGIGVAVIGVVLASGPELSSGVAGRRRTLALAAASALSFGSVLICLDRGSAHNVVMTLLVMRVASVTVVSCALTAYLLRSRAAVQRPGLRDLGIAAFIGWTDAGANGLYGLATRQGLVSVVAVLASLYPAVTVLLARVVHDERLRGVQATGVAFTLCGVVLLAAG
jgi:drug/metabolite transporter (DMT)-like permease